jgi:hypothetical protein
MAWKALVVAGGTVSVSSSPSDSARGERVESSTERLSSGVNRGPNCTSPSPVITFVQHTFRRLGFGARGAALTFVNVCFRMLWQPHEAIDTACRPVTAQPNCPPATYGVVCMQRACVQSMKPFLSSRRVLRCVLTRCAGSATAPKLSWRPCATWKGIGHCFVAHKDCARSTRNNWGQSRLELAGRVWDSSESRAHVVELEPVPR